MLEGPDRDAWQRPEQIMDALLIARGKQSSLTSAPAAAGSRSGWPTASARTASSTPRTSSREMIEAIKRRVEARRRCKNVKTVLGTAVRSPAARAGGRRADRRRVPRDGAAGRHAAQRRGRAEADRHASASSSSQEGRWGRPADGRARGSRDASSAMPRPRASGCCRRETFLPISIHAGVRAAEMTPVPPFFADYQRSGRSASCAAWFPDSGEPRASRRRWRYTLHAPSKRVRAVLALLAAELCGGDRATALPAACAIEMVHASSLILDDLPSMDDAPLRRGKPANHVEFGEAIAILAAFGLLDGAFGVIARCVRAGGRVAADRARSSDAVGSQGLIGGQAADLLATDQQITFEMLERIHRGKTGALFSAAATAGAHAAAAPADSIARCRRSRRTSGSRSRSSTTCSTSKAIPRITGKPVREDARRPRSCRSAGWRARGSSPPSCATPRIARSRLSARRAERLRELSAFVAGRMM